MPSGNNRAFTQIIRLAVAAAVGTVLVQGVWSLAQTTNRYAQPGPATRPVYTGPRAGYPSTRPVVQPYGQPTTQRAFDPNDFYIGRQPHWPTTRPYAVPLPLVPTTGPIVLATGAPRSATEWAAVFTAACKAGRPDDIARSRDMLKKLGAQQAIPALAVYLGDRPVFHPPGVHGLLAEFGEAAVPTLMAALKDPYPPRREQAAMGLQQIGVKAAPATRELIRLTTDSEQIVAIAAVRALGAINTKDPERIAGLVRVAVQGTDAPIKLAALDGLEQVTPADLKPHAAEFAKLIVPPGAGRRLAPYDPASIVMQRAIVLSGRIGPDLADAVVPKLRELLKQNSMVVDASRALALMGPKGIAALVDAAANPPMEALQGNWFEYRGSICDAARDAGPAAAAMGPSLASQVKNPFAPMSVKAMMAIAAIGKGAGPEAIAALKAKAAETGGPDNSLALVAARILKRIDGSPVTPLKPAAFVSDPIFGGLGTPAELKQEVEILKRAIASQKALNNRNAGNIIQPMDPSRSWNVTVAATGDRLIVSRAPDQWRVQSLATAAISAARQGDLATAALLLEDAELADLSTPREFPNSSSPLALALYELAGIERAGPFIQTPDTLGEIFSNAIKRGDLQSAEMLAASTASRTGLQKISTTQPVDPYQTNDRLPDQFLLLAAACNKAGDRKKAAHFYAQSIAKGLRYEALEQAAIPLVQLGEHEILIESLKASATNRSGNAMAILPQLMPQMVKSGQHEAALKILTALQPQSFLRMSEELDPVLAGRCMAAIAMAANPQLKAAAQKLLAETTATLGTQLAESAKANPTNTERYVRARLSVIRFVVTAHAVAIDVTSAKAAAKALNAPLTLRGAQETSNYADAVQTMLASELAWLGDQAGAAQAIAAIGAAYPRQEAEGMVRAIAQLGTPAVVKKLVDDAISRGAMSSGYLAVYMRSRLQPYVAPGPQIYLQVQQGDLVNAAAVAASQFQSSPMEMRQTILELATKAGASPKWNEVVPHLQKLPFADHLLHRVAVGRASAGDLVNARMLLAKGDELAKATRIPPELLAYHRLHAETRMLIAGRDKAAAAKLLRAAYPLGAVPSSSMSDQMQVWFNMRGIAETWVLAGDAAGALAYIESLPPDNRHRESMTIGLIDALHYRLTGQWQLQPWPAEYSER